MRIVCSKYQQGHRASGYAGIVWEYYYSLNDPLQAVFRQQ